MSALGELILGRRKALGLSQQAVADRMAEAGCSAWRTTISQIERGVISLPDPPTLHALAAALELAPAALMAAAGYPVGQEIDAGFAHLRQSYEAMDAIRRREIVALADAMLRVQRSE